MCQIGHSNRLGGGLLPLAMALFELPAGTVLEGEVVIFDAEAALSCGH